MLPKHPVCSSPTPSWSRSSQTWRRRCRSWSHWHRPPWRPRSPPSAAPGWRISAPGFWWSPKRHPQSISDNQFFSSTWYLRSLSLAWVTFRWKRGEMVYVEDNSSYSNGHFSGDLCWKRALRKLMFCLTAKYSLTFCATKSVHNPQ